MEKRREPSYEEFRKPSYPPMEQGWHWYYARQDNVSDRIEPVAVMVVRLSSGETIHIISHYGHKVPSSEFTWFGPVHTIKEG